MLLLMGMTAIQSCQNELDVVEPKGGLHITLDNVSSSTNTRSTPSEIGVPTADKFHLSVVDTKGMSKYDGPVVDDTITLAAGTYSLTADYGENPVLALEKPYYVGTTQVTVVSEKVADANINCRVGNALISAVFGLNEAERVRFNKFYKEYGLDIKVENYLVTIPSTNSNLSAYFRAGSEITLKFSGVLRESDRSVSCTLNASDVPNFPQTFEAADHAIITLTLPDPENVAVVNIGKVEMQEATMEETIPLSWLPVPKVPAAHQYDGTGALVGTNLSFQDCYFGMTWKAVVTNSNLDEVRTVQGTNALSSVYSSSQNWPYLPKGNYTATYFLVKEGEEPSRLGSRTFTIGSPDKLKVNITGGYTSYTKYLAGDIDGANACDAFTIYQPTASFALSSAITNGANYKNLSYEFSSTIDGTSYGSTKTGTKNSGVLDNATGLTPSLSAHTIGVNAKFDGGSASASGQYFITGLPVEFTPPSEGAGWSKSGNVDWNQTDNGSKAVRLGYMALSQPHYIEYHRVAVPKGTIMQCPYKVRINNGWVSTTMTLSAGSKDYFSSNKEDTYESSATFAAPDDITFFKANSSWGSGAVTHSFIYYLKYKYGKQ